MDVRLQDDPFTKRMVIEAVEEVPFWWCHSILSLQFRGFCCGRYFGTRDIFFFNLEFLIFCESLIRLMGTLTLWKMVRILALWYSPRRLYLRLG